MQKDIDQVKSGHPIAPETVFQPEKAECHRIPWDIVRKHDLRFCQNSERIIGNPGNSNIGNIVQYRFAVPSRLVSGKGRNDQHSPENPIAVQGTVNSYFHK